MIIAAITTIVIALVLLAWLLLGPPDQDTLDKLNESARPYDAPSATRKP
jgi:hypothetical protein